MTNFYLSFSRYVTVLLVLASSVAIAQTRTVTGKVTSASDGTTLPGVNIVMKGTAVGTTSDSEGQYSINVEGNATLVFTFVGFATQEIAVGSQSTVNVVLQDDVTSLNEVVVEGYGTIKKRDFTGAVAQVSAAELNKGIYTSPAQLLQGKIAGLLVVGASGAPGAETAIQIRGVSSLRSGNAPLIVIDGIQIDNNSSKAGFNVPGLGNSPGIDPLSFINSADIDRIDVLKDASATAIYGSRGANGVIMITTKKAAAGISRIDFSASAGVSTISKKLDVLNGDQYRAALTSEKISGGDFGDNVNAFDKIIRTGSSQNYNLGFSAGSDHSSHRISLGYTDVNGIIKKSGMKKYNAMLKSNYSFLNDKIKLDVLLLGAHVEQQNAPIGNNSPTTGNVISQALQWNPTKSLYNPDGTLNQPQEVNEVNPLATLAAYDDKFLLDRIVMSVAPTINLAKGLDYKVQIAVDHQQGDHYNTLKKSLLISGNPGIGNALYGTNQQTSQQYSHTLSYNKQISNLNVTALLGYEYIKIRTTGVTMGASNFTSDVIDFSHNFDNVLAANTFIVSNAPPDQKLQSFFGRAGLNYADQFRLTATLRADGSSKFGPANRYGVFPAFGFTWSLDKQAFLPKSINSLTLRLGWGETGNQSFPSGLSTATYGFGQGATTASLKQLNPPADKLRWETSTTTNIAIDFGILDSRISGSIDVYDKRTSNLLFNLTTAQPGPAFNYWTNLSGAIVQNRGIELGLKGEVIDRGNLRFDIGANISFRSNKFIPGPSAESVVVPTGSLDGQGLTGVLAQETTKGHSLNSWYLPQFTGIDENGLSTYKGAVAGINPKYFVGSPYPTMIGGITFNLAVGKFDATMAFNGVSGNKIYNNTANSVFVKANLGSRNTSPDLVGNGESPSNIPTPSTRYLENGSFLRMSNLTLGYNFDLKSNTMKNLRVYFTGQNLFVITKYTGFDPEVNTDKTVNGVPAFGIDYTQYPRARSFVLGIAASF